MAERGHMHVLLGGEPDSLRGPQCQLCYIDELAKMRYAQDVFDQARMGLRLGGRPRMIITTTPRPSAFMKALIALPGVSIARGSTFDNAANLSADFLTRIREAFQNSRAWLQEIQGEMILEPEDALFKSEWLIHHDVPQEMIEQVTVGVDPSGGGDMIGIVVAALLTDGRFAKLTIGLELAPGQSDGATAASTAASGENAVGTLPEEPLVREIVTNAITNQNGETLISDQGRTAIKQRILQAIAQQTDIKVEAVLIPDLTVQ